MKASRASSFEKAQYNFWALQLLSQGKQEVYKCNNFVIKINVLRINSCFYRQLTSEHYTLNIH